MPKNASEVPDYFLLANLQYSATCVNIDFLSFHG
jgi:hypothetical protein